MVGEVREARQPAWVDAQEATSPRERRQNVSFVFFLVLDHICNFVLLMLDHICTFFFAVDDDDDDDESVLRM